MNLAKSNVTNQPKALFLGPIHSIKIPLVRQQSDMESDLTELSWLTNSINILGPKFYNTSISPPKKNINVVHSKTATRKEAKKYEESQVCLKEPESPSSFSSSSSSCSSISPCLSPSDLSNSSQKTKKTSKNNLKLQNDCGLNKPSITLSCLIFMALEESDENCLPVREIYEWIEENFEFYKKNENSGWKSSIRHNLSFSKCFKKMDRNESFFLRQRSGTINENNNNNGSRKRRAPNSVGTCWKVNEECREYLIQTLKKSTFWKQNSKYYPNLSKLVENFASNDLKTSHSHQENVNTRKKVKIEVNENFLGDYLNDYNSNLLEFVQKQQEKLNDSIKSEKLDLSASSSSLSSVFSNASSNESSCKRLRIDEDLTDKLSSDLEMEVASTLVDMKRFASMNKN